MRYSIVIARTKNSFCAYSPDVPGCIAAGHTIAEVKQLMAEALESHFECIEEDNEPIPQPKSLVAYVEVSGFGEKPKDYKQMNCIEVAYCFLYEPQNEEALKELRTKSKENGVTIPPEVSTETIVRTIENIDISND